MNNDEDDSDLFRKLYGDIEPVRHERHEPRKKLPRPVPRAKNERDTVSHTPLTPYPEDDLSYSQPESGQVYRANGVQNRQMLKLRKGKIPVEAILDLHGMTREEALVALQQYISESQDLGLKCIQVIHGKGYRSAAGKPVLKPAVAYWLKELTAVLAFCPAQPRDGGDGALYVLLRRGEL